MTATSASLRERLSRCGCVLQRAGAASSESPSRRAASERVQGFRDLEGGDRSLSAGTPPLALEQPPVEQHPDRLDRVERDTLGTIEHLGRRMSSGRPGTKPSSSSSIASCASGSSESVVELARAPPPWRCRSPNSGRARARDEQGDGSRPLEEVLEELERGASAHCMSSKTRTTGSLSARRSRKSRQPPKRSDIPRLRGCRAASSCGSARLGSTHVRRGPRRSGSSAAWQLRAGGLGARLLRRSRPASAPSPPARRTRTRRRRRDSGPDATGVA